MGTDLLAQLASLHDPDLVDRVARQLRKLPETAEVAGAAEVPAFITEMSAWAAGQVRPASIPEWLWRRIVDLPAHAWRRNPGYSGTEFVDRYAYTELVGPAGRMSARDAAFGLLALAPGTVYPMHEHPAVETYVVLMGAAEWRAGAQPWTVRLPGTLVHHPSGVGHAMRTGDHPLLAAYLWSGEISTRARLSGGRAMTPT